MAFSLLSTSTSSKNPTPNKNRDPNPYTSRYASVSPPLLLPGQQAFPPRQLRLFEGVAPPTTRAAPTKTGAGQEGGGSGSGSGNGNGTNSRNVSAAAPRPPPLPPWSDAGCAFFAGGPVWALDWCPEEGEEEEEETRRLLAVSAHPPATATTAIGQRLSGPALVQIWSVPRYCSLTVEEEGGGDRRSGKRPKLASTETAATPTLLPSPALAFALAHGGCLARDLKWRPGPPPPSSSSSPDTIGVLAAALGDGSLTLWSVPSEAAVKKEKEKQRQKGGKSSSSSSSSSSSAALVIIDLPPLAVGTGCGLLSAVAWCPRKGNGGEDELATAGFDGSAVLWRVEAAAAASDDDASPSSPLRLVPLLRTPRDAGGPLRCLAFPPSPGLALSHSHSDFCTPRLRAFATAGHSPDARLWDASDPGRGCLLARLPLSSSRAWVFSMAWLSVPLGLLLAQDGGRLLFVPLDGGGRAAGAEAAVAPSGNKRRGLNKKKKKSEQTQQQQNQQDLSLCRVAGGAESRDDAVWAVAACPGTATLAAYCTSGGFVGTVDVLPTPAAREAARRLVASSGGRGERGAGGGNGNQAVVSGFVPASAVVVASPSFPGSSSTSVVVALPLTSEMKGLATGAESAAEAEAAAQQRADAAAGGGGAAAAGAVPRGGGGGGGSRCSSSGAAAAGRGGRGRGGRATIAAGAAAAGPGEQNLPPPPRPVFALRDARLSVNCLAFSSRLDFRYPGAWSALAAGGGLGVVRVHEVDVERVARGRV